jgi:hypothetical protein
MASDQFQSQLEWVRGLAGDDKVKAGSVVSWQAIAATLNEIVKHFNVIAFGSEEPKSRRYREVQLKKVVIGLLYEMDACLDYWANELRKADLLDQDITDKKKEFKTACKKVGLDVLKQVRNGVAFHYTDYLSDPDAIVTTYEKVDQITLDSINDILRAANLCGFAMRDKVVDSMS